MQRRGLLAGFLALPGLSGWGADAVHPVSLTSSGPMQSTADGQVIENQDITAPSGDALTIRHRGVTVRNCRIRHTSGHGLHGDGAQGLVVENIDVERVGRVPRSMNSARYCNNINLTHCRGATLRRVKATAGSSNVYIEFSENCRLNDLELHDARGPYPRGQNVQFNESPRSVLENFSGENGPTSWTEDNVSVFRSDKCRVRRGLVFYNNSPTGDGIMLEGSSDCVVEDVDAVQQGNGAFAAVPVDDIASGGCVFRRCRTRATYNSRRDGRGRPDSNGLSFYMIISDGAPKHSIIDCHYDHLANPYNLIWDARAVNDGWSFTAVGFTPRKPVRLHFSW